MHSGSLFSACILIMCMLQLLINARSSAAAHLIICPCHLCSCLLCLCPACGHLHALQLSPGGDLLAYIKPDATSGTANIFVRKLPPQGARPARSEGFESEISIFARDGTDDDVQITFDSDEGVSSYSWTEDGGSVVFVQDKDGDENFHLYLSSVNNPAAAIDLTPFPGVKAEGIVSSERFPDRMFIVSWVLGAGGWDRGCQPVVKQCWLW